MYQKCEAMPRIMELHNFERASVITLRNNGLSFRQIGAAIGCHHSTIIRTCEHNEKIRFPDKLKEVYDQKQLILGERGIFVVLQSSVNVQS